MHYNVCNRLSLETTDTPGATAIDYSQPVALGLDNSVMVNGTVFVLDGNPGEVDRNVAIQIEGSQDLENWGATTGFVNFLDPGYQRVSVAGLSVAYVRLKVTLENGSDEPSISGAHAVLSAGIHTAKL